MNDSTARTPRLSRKEWALLALGLGMWIALAAGGVWFVHQLTRPREDCASAAEAPTRPARGTTTPRNAFTALAGQGRCK
jgi:hypothetical protein